MLKCFAIVTILCSMAENWKQKRKIKSYTSTKFQYYIYTFFLDISDKEITPKCDLKYK